MESAQPITRRVVIGTVAGAAAGTFVGASTAIAVEKLLQSSDSGAVGKTTVPFHGDRQAGIETPVQANAAFLGFDLKPEADAAAIARLLRLWTTDAALLVAGKPSLGDSNAEAANAPSALTITVGFGHEVFLRTGSVNRWPLSTPDLPAFSTDRLLPAFVGGHLFLQVCADDATVISHAVHELSRDAEPFAHLRWIQRGFRTAAGVKPGMTPRNLFGQVDGSGNPPVGSSQFTQAVWNRDDTSTLVLRRIRMDLQRWDLLSRKNQEQVIGRNRTNGAPLTGKAETDIPDLTATKDGNLAIAEDAHIRRATTPRNIFRRVYNYDDGIAADGSRDQGMLFASYQADPQQFIDIQARLAKLDALNRWTTHTGSAVFVIPRGVRPGDWWGSDLF